MGSITKKSSVRYMDQELMKKQYRYRDGGFHRFVLNAKNSTFFVDLVQ